MHTGGSTNRSVINNRKFSEEINRKICFTSDWNTEVDYPRLINETDDCTNKDMGIELGKRVQVQPRRREKEYGVVSRFPHCLWRQAYDMSGVKEGQRQNEWR
ncbi:hypothetical protein V6N11_015995 [Hibiscus sabdariffa]|uniref:Uncharacterized protein n=1 Tax=Hibiscus sabdariffa TaxID=183260 RepID=A0ABR2TTY9_9ROSI